MKLLVTGGAGFIGSAYVRMILSGDRAAQLVCLDKLTYAGNLENLEPIKDAPGFRFVRGDIADKEFVLRLFQDEAPDAVVHFAAESHVDRSISGPGVFVQTNITGTFNLLEAARACKTARFVHVSTDEVYGSIDEPFEADEEAPLRASSPYSASKAGSDLLVRSYFHTFHMPVLITRASNNYGPYQFPEKLIPLMISRALEGQDLPVYGDGRQVRDWLHVEDHCRGIDAVLRRGREGEVYNVGGNRSLPNRDVVDLIIAATGASPDQIKYVADRPGHDRRYAITTEKLSRETGWTPQVAFEDGLAATVQWYKENTGWVSRVKRAEYMTFWNQNYLGRGAVAGQ